MTIATMSSAIAVTLLLVAVGASAVRADATSPQRTLDVKSPAFGENQMIPDTYTCGGAKASPPLAWSNVPAGAKSIAILVEDPDAMNYAHWIVTNLPVTILSLAAGAALPKGAIAGKNDAGMLGYAPPCPPEGKHHYVFRVYALDKKLAPKPMTKDQLLEAMASHVLAEGSLIATAEKPGTKQIEHEPQKNDQPAPIPADPY